MIGKLLGHADIQSTARYAHLARDVEQASAARVGVSIGADIMAGARLTTITGDWYRLRARAGLDDVRIHDLRHSFASRALAAGESLSMIGKLLGHADIQSTARYAHLARDVEQASAARVGVSIGADIMAENSRTA